MLLDTFNVVVEVIVVPFSIVEAVIVIFPGLKAVTKPLLTVAIKLSELSQLIILLVFISPFSSK